MPEGEDATAMDASRLPPKAPGDETVLPVDPEVLLSVCGVLKSSIRNACTLVMVRSKKPPTIPHTLVNRPLFCVLMVILLTAPPLRFTHAIIFEWMVYVKIKNCVLKHLYRTAERIDCKSIRFVR